MGTARIRERVSPDGAVVLALDYETQGGVALIVRTRARHHNGYPWQLPRREAIAAYVLGSLALNAPSCPSLGRTPLGAGASQRATQTHIHAEEDSTSAYDHVPRANDFLVASLRDGYPDAPRAVTNMSEHCRTAPSPLLSS